MRAFPKGPHIAHRLDRTADTDSDPRDLNSRDEVVPNLLRADIRVIDRILFNLRMLNEIPADRLFNRKFYSYRSFTVDLTYLVSQI